MHVSLVSSVQCPQFQLQEGLYRYSLNLSTFGTGNYAGSCGGGGGAFTITHTPDGVPPAGSGWKEVLYGVHELSCTRYMIHDLSPVKAIRGKDLMLPYLDANRNRDGTLSGLTRYVNIMFMPV